MERSERMELVLLCMAFLLICATIFNNPGGNKKINRSPESNQ